MYHKPVLLNESINALNIIPEGIYVDATFGGGGHSKAILSNLTSGKLIAFDQDPDAADNIPGSDQFLFIGENFRFLKNFLRINGINEVDGLLADLGVSSHQFDTPGRGFSTRYDGPLDMRMSVNNPTTARQVINGYEEDELTRMFREYGELPNALKLAKMVVNRRRLREIITTSDLRDAIDEVLPRGRENQYLARVFQAIRLEVNDELSALKDLLEQGTAMLRQSGRFVVITYHSLEDRLVKNYFKAGNFTGKVSKDFFGRSNQPLKPVVRKPITPKPDEIKENNRARSAKLRIAEKT
jgi:16S rRNA (cytosine1402-N4)-methyltransferase